jgi:muconolactone delta-isomerase
MTRKVFSDQTYDQDPTYKGDSQEEPMVNLFHEIKRQVEDSETATAQWADRQDRYYKMRMRVKKARNFPFKNASNIRMPTAEKNIRKLKAGLMGIIFGVRPIVSVQPSPSTTLERAQKIEKFLDHMLMNVIGIDKLAEIAIDQSLEKGFYFMKPYWRREVIDRDEEIDLEELPLADVLSIFLLPKEIVVQNVVQRFNVDTHDVIFEENLQRISKVLDEIVEEGSTKVTLTVRDVIYDYPDIALASPERVYAPVDSGHGVQETTNITHELFVPLEQLKRDADYKGYDKEAIDAISSLRNINIHDKDTDFSKDEKEGITRLQNPSGLVRVWETYGWFDIDGDGELEKSMVTSFPDFNLVARAIKLNSLSGKYPFVKLFYELTDDRWMAHRGVPEMLEDIIKEIDIQHNMKIDSQTIRNAPMFVYRAGMINPNLIKMRPNQAIPVNGLQPLGDALQVLNFHNPNTEFSYEREQQILNLEVQETVGQIDFSLQSQINRRQPRTLGEVESQIASSGQVFSMDARHYIQAFGELFSMILELWSQFGPEEYEFIYFGDTAQGESIKLTKEEIQNKYTVAVRGNDQNLNPARRIEKAQQILAALRDPLLLQSGIIGPQQIANGLRRFYRALDIENADDLINPDIAPQMPQPDPAVGLLNTKAFSDLTEGEQAQVLQRVGIQPDMNDRQRRQLQDIIVKTADASSKIE